MGGFESVITKLNDKATFAIPVGISQLGTPVIDNVIFPAGKFQDLDGNIITYPELKLDDARININRSKKIVKSSINGQDGEVKEYITLNDYVISINGSINSILSFPSGKWQAFSKLERVPERVRVLSKFLNSIFSIDYVVIESFDAGQEGSINDYPLSILMVSDFAIDFSKFG